MRGMIREQCTWVYLRHQTGSTLESLSVLLSFTIKRCRNSLIVMESNLK